MEATAAPTIADHESTRDAAPLDASVAVGTAMLDVGVTSPSAVATPPRRVLSSAQTLRSPSTTFGRSSELRNCVWFVCVKLEAA